MEVNNLEVEEDLSTTMATVFWAEGVWMGKWEAEQQGAWRRQVFEVQTWKQVRGPARSVMCETRDLGIKWPRWHTLLFEGQVSVDMRVVCPQDVKKMLLRQARIVYWKRWAAKHECEELTEGVWLEPIQAMMRRTISEAWTDKHRHVTRKLVVGAEKIVRHWLVRRKEVSMM